jgi:DmsE family decaheme c-type cytochrome
MLLRSWYRKACYGWSMRALWGFLALCVLAPVPSLAAGDYVGSNVCKTCHADIWAPFYRNPHFKGLASGKEAPENTGCESCHGPGKAHVEAGGGADTIPRAFSRLTPTEVLDTCLRCHSQTLSRANIRRSEHTQEEVVCTNCHSIHKSTTPKFLLAKKQSELCYTCHANVRAQFSMPFKHRVNEGFMQCTDCHNPHGSNAPTWRVADRPHNTEQAQANEEPCLKCHIDKRGPFVFEHPSVRIDGCETCHNPHGSVNAKLLKRPVVFTMCLECHTGVGKFGPLGGIPQPSSTHNLADPRYQNCTSCHVRIHGSNADVYFFR